MKKFLNLITLPYKNFNFLNQAKRDGSGFLSKATDISKPNDSEIKSANYVASNSDFFKAFQSLSFFKRKNEISLEKINFPLYSNKMYGGAVMAKTVYDSKKNVNTVQESVLSFHTIFFKPIKSLENLYFENQLISEGRSIKWIKSALKSNLIDSAHTQMLIQKKTEETAFKTPLKHIPSSTISFYDFLIKRFNYVEDEHKDHLSHDFIKSTSEILNLRVVNCKDHKMLLSYEVAPEIEDQFVKIFLVYYIDIIIVSFTSIFTNMPIYDKKRVFISSVNHQMNFFDNQIPRSGFIELKKISKFKNTSVYNINALFYDLNKKLFSKADQNVYADLIQSVKP